MTVVDVVTVRDLRNRGGQVLGEVARGHSFTVTRDGDPIAEIRPLPRPGLRAGELVARAKRLPRIDSRAFFADIDAVVGQSW